MYKLLYGSDTIRRLADGAGIPPDPKNADYVAYLEWLAKGGIPEAADVPPAPVPKAELPTPVDVDKLDLAGVKDVLKLLIERVEG